MSRQSDSQGKDTHPATAAILEFFTFDHLPEPQRDIARECAMHAHTMAGELGDTAHGAELTTGLRKLLEAKDCFVRASLRSTLVERHDHVWGDWLDDPAGVIRRCSRCPEIDWRPEG